MRRRPLVLAAASLALLVGLQLGGSWPPARADAQSGPQPSAPFCQPGQEPAFVLGIADLKARLGDTMGAPLECEHLDAESGDTVQHTTTGLAYYRPSLNATMFTDGATHWALSGGS